MGVVKGNSAAVGAEVDEADTYAHSLAKNCKLSKTQPHGSKGPLRMWRISRWIYCNVIFVAFFCQKLIKIL